MSLSFSFSLCSHRAAKKCRTLFFSLLSFLSKHVSSLSEIYLATRKMWKIRAKSQYMSILRTGWKCRINSRTVGVGEQEYPIVYLLTLHLGWGVNSSRRWWLNYYMKVYGARASRIDAPSPGRGTQRYARRRLDFQLAAYRLLVFDICFPFREAHRSAPSRPPS